MELFIDTSNIEQIQKYRAFKIFTGVTTNPALLSKEKGNPLDTLKKILEIMEDKPVSAQVTSDSYTDMIKQGLKLSKISNSIVVKLPANENGFKALVELSIQGIKTNITLCFDPSVATMFAQQGANYVSMILGRSDDFNLNQQTLIKRTRKIFDKHSLDNKILAASLRNPFHVELAMRQGADILTIPPSTIEMLFDNPLTNSGSGDFKKMWLNLSEQDRQDYDIS